MARDTILESGSKSDSGLSLAMRLQAGSAEAWADFVRLYGPLVDRWCRVAGVPTDSIPDVAQSVFLTAFRKVASFDAGQSNASFRGWLWAVTRSRVADFFRRRGEQGRGGSTMLQQLAAVPDLIEDEPSQPDDISRLLHRALDQIQCEFEPNTWDMFWRATVLGHPTDLIATDYNVTPAAVRQSKSRVLRRLRKQL
jgi:RNA polymerase sigma-70 factor (ECF subfamily)